MKFMSFISKWIHTLFRYIRFQCLFFFFFFGLFVIRVQSESSDRYPCSVGEHFFIAWFAFNVGSIDSLIYLLKSAISSDKCNKSLTLSSRKKNGASNSPGKMTFSFRRNFQISPMAQWLLICCHNCKINDFYRVVHSWLVFGIRITRTLLIDRLMTIAIRIVKTSQMLIITI